MKRKADTQAQPYIAKFSRGQVDRAGNRPGVSGGGQRRQGYAGVPRTQGAAVVGEMKYFDTILDGVAVAACTTTWPVARDPSTTVNLGSAAVLNPLSLFVPTVGAALNQRIGRKVKVMKIKIHGMLTTTAQAGQATADSPCLVRLMLVQDCQTNAAQMTGAQLMNDGTNASTTIHSFQNPNNFGRFKVIKEKRIVFANSAITGDPTAGNVIQSSEARTFKMNVKFKVPVEVHFNATNGGTVADIVDNSWHIIVAANDVSYVPAIAYYARICYKE